MVRLRKTRPGDTEILTTVNTHTHFPQLQIHFEFYDLLTGNTYGFIWTQANPAGG
jgi:hypothetical protein